MKSIGTMNAAIIVNEMNSAQLINEIESGIVNSNYNKRIIYLYTLSTLLQLKVTNAEKTRDILYGMNGEVEDIRNAAATALGSSIDNVKFIEEKLKNGENSFFLLTALKETVRISTSPELRQDLMNVIIDIRIKQELCKNILGEVLGRLMAYDIENNIDKMCKFCKEKDLSPGYILSIRYALSYTDNIDSFSSVVNEVINNLSDGNPDTKRALANVINFLIQKERTFIKPYIHRIFDALLPALEQDKNFVQEGQFGALKITLDKGLESRKNVYECFNSMLERFQNNIDIKTLTFAILNHLRNDNQQDIKLLCLNILSKIATIDIVLIVQNIENIISCIEDLKFLEPFFNQTAGEKVTDQQKIDIARGITILFSQVSSHKYAMISERFDSIVNKMRSVSQNYQIFSSL